MSKIRIPAGLLTVTFAAITGAAMVTAASSAVAAPATSAVAGLHAAMPELVTQARSEPRRTKHKRVYRNGTYRNGAVRAQVGPGPGYFAPQPFWQDNVSSIIFDGYGHGYNRFSGERYFKCMTDEGYGRARPCDAGDGGFN